MSAITTCAAPAPSPTGTICRTRHSNAAGASATRGGRTFELGTAAIPNAANSLSPCGSRAAQAFIFSASACGTICTTHSGTASRLSTVSFFAPSRRFTGTKSRVGGLAVTPLKNENGARFDLPSASTVDTHAIGRGVIKSVIQV